MELAPVSKFKHKQKFLMADCELEIPSRIQSLTVSLLTKYYYLHFKKVLEEKEKNLGWSESLPEHFKPCLNFTVDTKWIKNAISHDPIIKSNDNSIHLTIGYYRYTANKKKVFNLQLRHDNSKLFLCVYNRHVKQRVFGENNNWNLIEVIDNTKNLEFLEENDWLNNFVCRFKLKNRIQEWNLRLGVQIKTPHVLKVNSKNVAEIDSSLARILRGENVQETCQNRKYSSKAKAGNRFIFGFNDNIIHSPELKEFFQKAISIGDLATAIKRIPDLMKQVFVDYDKLEENKEKVDLIRGAIASHLYTNLAWKMVPPVEILNCSVENLQGDIDQVTLTVRDFAGSEIIQQEIENLLEKRHFLTSICPRLSGGGEKEEEAEAPDGVANWKIENDLSKEIGLFGGIHRYHKQIKEKVFTHFFSFITVIQFVIVLGIWRSAQYSSISYAF